MRTVLAALGAMVWMCVAAAPAPAATAVDTTARVAAEIAADGAIRATLAAWTEDFNAGRADRICDLFAPDLRYDYRGFPERGFSDICRLLRASLGDRTRSYTYALQIKEILMADDLAVVRLVWTLTVRPAGATDGGEVSQEPGLDVFRRNPAGT